MLGQLLPMVVSSGSAMVFLGTVACTLCQVRKTFESKRKECMLGKGGKEFEASVHKAYLDKDDMHSKQACKQSLVTTPLVDKHATSG